MFDSGGIMIVLDEMDIGIFLFEVTGIGIILRDEIADFVMVTSGKGDEEIEVAFIGIVVVGSGGAFVVLEGNNVIMDVGEAEDKGIDDVDNECPGFVNAESGGVEFIMVTEVDIPVFDSAGITIVLEKDIGIFLFEFTGISIVVEGIFVKTDSRDVGSVAEDDVKSIVVVESWGAVIVFEDDLIVFDVVVTKVEGFIIEAEDDGNVEAEGTDIDCVDDGGIDIVVVESGEVDIVIKDDVIGVVLDSTVAVIFVDVVDAAMFLVAAPVTGIIVEDEGVDSVDAKCG